MKEMIYQEDRKFEVLQDAKYKDYRYIILNLGTHPTAYIEIPKDHKLYGKDYDDIELDVHGGLTYASSKLIGIASGGWFIGWDYAHYGDYSGYDIRFPQLMRGEKKWTTEEIEEECKNAIEQIINMETEDDKDIPLIPDDELYIMSDVENYKSYEKLDYNFKILKEKVNQVVEEFNEYRKEHE